MFIPSSSHTFGPLTSENPSQKGVHSQWVLSLPSKSAKAGLVIDGVSSYSTAVEDQRSYRDFFHALVSYSKFHLMTTFFNYENPELFGMSAYMPEFPVSSIVDNIILLSLVELGNSLHRCIAVVKARGCKHEFDTREFTIGQNGITLLPLNEQATLPAMPIESYSSVVSRAPTRVSLRRHGLASFPPAPSESSE
jgi:KaiC/GvpD/RAD55 family RecA-like ATPase